jgi:MFS superfamily sulfate permease-like transporter
MPQAALAAVVIRYSLELIQPKQFLAIRRVRTTEFRWSVIAFAGVILLGTLQGIVVAVIDSLLSLAHQAYSPPLYTVARKPGTAVFRPIGPDHRDDESWPDLLLLRIEGRLFFANAQRVADLIWAQQQRTRAHVLAIDCSAVIDVEYTAIRVLEQLDDKLRRDGCELWLAGMTRRVFDVVERSGIGAQIGHERMYLSLQAAVEAYERRCGPESIDERAAGQGREALHQA